LYCVANDAETSADDGVTIVSEEGEEEEEGVAFEGVASGGVASPAFAFASSSSAAGSGVGSTDGSPRASGTASFVARVAIGALDATPRDLTDESESDPDDAANASCAERAPVSSGRASPFVAVAAGVGVDFAGDSSASPSPSWWPDRVPRSRSSRAAFTRVASGVATGSTSAGMASGADFGGAGAGRSVGRSEPSSPRSPALGLLRVGSAAGWVCCGCALPFASAAAAFSFSFSLLASRAALTFAWRSVLKSRSDGIFLSFSAFRFAAARDSAAASAAASAATRAAAAPAVASVTHARWRASLTLVCRRMRSPNPSFVAPHVATSGIVSTPESSDAGLGAGAGAGMGAGSGTGVGAGASGTSRVEASPGRFPADVSAVVAPASFDGTPAAPAAPPEDASAADGPAADDPGAEASAPAPVPNASAPTPRVVGAPSVAAVDPADAPADASAANARI